MPGPRRPLPSLGETVDGEQDGHDTAREPRVDEFVDGLVIRPPIEADAAFELRPGDLPVSGHHRPVRQLHDEGWIVEPPVGVDQEPRIACGDHRRTKAPADLACHGCGTNVIGDMAGELILAKPQAAVALGQRIAGMIAQDDKARLLGSRLYDKALFRRFVVGRTFRIRRPLRSPRGAPIMRCECIRPPARASNVTRLHRMEPSCNRLFGR